MNYLGRYLKKRLNELRMSEREISARCGISHSYLNQLIKGVNPSTKRNISPTLVTFEKLAKGFGVSVDYLQKISRGIKTNETGNNGNNYYSPYLIKQINDFQDFMLEIGINKTGRTEEEWGALISRIKETVKDYAQDVELRK